MGKREGGKGEGRGRKKRAGPGEQSRGQARTGMLEGHGGHGTKRKGLAKGRKARVGIPLDLFRDGDWLALGPQDGR